MTTCNACGSRMVPDSSAIVPALGCVNCKRVIPRTAVRSPKLSKAEQSRALRAARRAKARGVSLP